LKAFHFLSSTFVESNLLGFFEGLSLTALSGNRPWYTLATHWLKLLCGCLLAGQSLRDFLHFAVETENHLCRPLVEMIVGSNSAQKVVQPAENLG
jgi:hypothetical protein